MPVSNPKRPVGELDLTDVDFVSILSELDDGVIITDKRGTIVFYNKQQAELDGLNPEYVVGRKVVDIYSLDEETSKIMRCIKTQKPLIGHFFIYQTFKGHVYRDF